MGILGPTHIADEWPVGLGDDGAWLVAIALVAVPVWLGAVMVRRVPGLRGRPWRVVALFAVAAGVAVTEVQGLGVWDALLTVFLAGCGAAAATVRERRGLRVAVASTLLTLGLSELVVRAVFPLPPTALGPRDARMVRSLDALDPPCMLMHPRDPAMMGRNVGLHPGAARRVLHVGDSMVAGNGVRVEQTFASLLAARHPGEDHLRLGAPGASVDADVLVAQRWSAWVPTQHVVVYAYLGNDAQDFEHPSPCCDLGPLVSTGSGVMRDLCPRPRWRFPVAWRMARMPVPYVLRVAADGSALAGRAAKGLDELGARWYATGRIGVRWDRWSGGVRDDVWEGIGAAFRWLAEHLRARHVRLSVVVLPARPTVDRALGLPVLGVEPWHSLEAGRTAHARMVAAARDAGIETFDAGPLVEAEVRAHGDDAVWAHDYPGDGHFGPAMHARLADWLDTEVLGGR